MKMQRAEKEALVTGLKDRITQSSTVYLTDFTGLSVKNMTDLRRRFRSAGIEFLVAKNTLALRALHEASIDSLDDVLAEGDAAADAADFPAGLYEDGLAAPMGKKQ